MTNSLRALKALAKPAIFALVVTLLAISPWPASAGKNPPASGDDTASNFKLRCSSCHGVSGAGDTSLGRTLKAADLRSPEVQQQSDAQLTQVIPAGGRKNMPSFSNSLTQDQIRGLVAYIRKLAGKVHR